MVDTFFDNDAFMCEFGRIIHILAVSEANIKLAIAAMCDLSPELSVVLTEPYGALNTKNVAKSIAKIKLLPKSREEFIGIIGNLMSHNKLRNSIAHNRWRQGKSPDSFKPMKVNIRNGKAEYIGLDEEETEYTAEDLNAVYKILFKFNSDLIDFMSNYDLFAIVEKRLDEQAGVMIGD